MKRRIEKKAELIYDHQNLRFNQDNSQYGVNK